MRNDWRTVLAAMEHLYRYASSSRLAPVASGANLRLAAETTEKPCFFEGDLNDPLISAQCLRAVSELVGTRFYVPPSMLARILREADPVVTVAEDVLRFEGFSACCSTYIRHDIDAGGFSAKRVRSGTVNVDFRDEMRAALADVRANERLQMTISSDALAIDHREDHVIERKVPLPVRWVKGFAEVQAHQAGMAHAICLGRIAAQRFLRGLPCAASNRPQWVVAHAASARLSTREVDGAVKIAGTQRLRILERLANHAEQLDVYFNPSRGSSAWVLRFGSQRLTVVLNAEPWRGFSGDGQVLSDLVSPGDTSMSDLRAQLHWQSVLNRDDLARKCDLTVAQVDKGLAQFAASGLLGYDLQRARYFHRVLPFDLKQLEAMNPRLESARKLVHAGAVTCMSDEGADVISNDVVHRVRKVSGELTCTCPWFAKHRVDRGPCKHMLAVEMQADVDYG
ncbi:SWIM zinc finger family protein [Litoreibacter roseus]|nr:SWIM zinc finger family protein [Litoreibacter roseus]